MKHHSYGFETAFLNDLVTVSKTMVFSVLVLNARLMFIGSSLLIISIKKAIIVLKLQQFFQYENNLLATYIERRSKKYQIIDTPRPCD